MGIKSGIGIGEAQVYDTSSIVNGYYKLIQEEQKKQAKYADELADVLSKVDFKNLDPIDYKYINQEYQKAKDIATKYSGSRNTLEQRLAISEAKKAMQSIDEYAMGARAWRKNIAEVAKDMMQDNPEDYDDESKDEVKKLISGSYADAIKLNRASITPFTYKRIQDASLVDKTIDGARKALQTMMEESGKFSKIVKDGFEQLVYSIPQESVTGLLTAEMTANPKIKFQFKELYKQMNPEAEKPTDTQLADFARSLYEKKYQQQSYKFIGNTFRQQKESQGEDLGWLQSGSPTSITIPYANGKGAVKASNYIGLSIPNKNFAGSEAIDMTTGSPVRSLKSSNDYQIVGIGNFPTIVKGNQVVKSGSLAQPNYESSNQSNIQYKPLVHVQQKVARPSGGVITTDLLVPIDRLPANVKSNKTISKILSGFRPATSNPSPSPVKPKVQPKPSSGKVDLSKFDKTSKK